MRMLLCLGFTLLVLVSACKQDKPGTQAADAATKTPSAGPELTQEIIRSKEFLDVATFYSYSEDERSKMEKYHTLLRKTRPTLDITQDMYAQLREAAKAENYDDATRQIVMEQIDRQEQYEINNKVLKERYPQLENPAYLEQVMIAYQEFLFGGGTPEKQ